jgi:hypothetical protein
LAPAIFNIFFTAWIETHGGAPSFKGQCTPEGAYWAVKSPPQARVAVWIRVSPWRYTGGLSTEQDSAFLQELIQKLSPAYEIFRSRAEDRADDSAEDSDATPVAAARLVDVIVAEQLRVPEGFGSRAALGNQALEAWGNAVEGAKPYRNSMQLIVDRFPEWWRTADIPGRVALVKHLPTLGPAVADVGDAGVIDLVAAGEPALACAASYALADKPAVQAIAKVARAGASAPERASAVLSELAAAFPISLIEDSREAERFLPALGKAVDAAGAGWAEAVELATTLVRNDPSSAYGVLEAVPKALGSVKGDKELYLGQFAALAKALGNRVAGVCLKRLPASTQAPAVVDRAIQLASLYGVNAAERYLETSL